MHKADCDNFTIESLHFFLPKSVSDVCIFCFAILSSNLSGRFMHLLRRYMHLITFPVCKISSVSRDAVFPAAMYLTFHCPVWLNVCIISHRRFITPYRRYCDTSLFFFWFSISKNDALIVVC